METAKPNIPEARAFAEGIHAVAPHQKLAYNLSPSFNWDAAGMSKREMAAFNRELGLMGFVWQVGEGAGGAKGRSTARRRVLVLCPREGACVRRALTNTQQCLLV